MTFWRKKKKMKDDEVKDSPAEERSPDVANTDEPKAAAAAEAAEETSAKPAAAEAPKSAAELAEEAGAQTAEETPAAGPDWKEMYARMAADFDNYRKRTARDRDDLAKFASAEVVKDLLPTVDNLAMALDKAANKEDPFVVGVKMAYDGFLKALAEHGATPIDSLGEPFDANFHEAIAQLPSPDVEEGKVMNEVKRGWLLHGKLLRAAQVVVSSGKAEG